MNASFVTKALLAVVAPFEVTSRPVDVAFHRDEHVNRADVAERFLRFDNGFRVSLHAAVCDCNKHLFRQRSK
ncbi:hypothetical protein PF006_g13685 [Phytophthora fragariae]|uniref:Secreted protein n=1 Tax=Phytophthora fragariae TaxID=53985 RepID=A0A6A3ELR5_9STRA|nr:hypothetical protein PF009_g15586 [Phytophthora fragariae]KAE8996550.1 hypothetical protein PF011_g15855 [Phytophthora fragariae]KAE9139682.1 hypothetical protein PF006_g13685 [Phytophthora fragariae]KAE9253251.1 hypothetical protein PF004_g1583 [Phytophthora fragariae]